MKKTLSIILIMTLLSSFLLLMLPTSAAEPTITEAEARQLLVDSYVWLLENKWGYGFTASTTETFKTLKQYDESTTVPKAEKYYRPNWDDERIASEKKEASDSAKKVFVPALLNKMTEYGFDGTSPLWYKHNSGSWFYYMGDCVYELDFPIGFVNPTNGKYSGYARVDGKYYQYDPMDDSFEPLSLTGDAKHATATFVVHIVTSLWDEYDLRTMSVEYTKTDEGWRISGGEYMNSICVDNWREKRNELEKYIPQSPSTGDETPIYIAVCAVSALTVIACGTSVARKRRRED